MPPFSLAICAVARPAQEPFSGRPVPMKTPGRGRAFRGSSGGLRGFQAPCPGLEGAASPGSGSLRVSTGTSGPSSTSTTGRGSRHVHQLGLAGERLLERPGSSPHRNDPLQPGLPRRSRAADRASSLNSSTLGSSADGAASPASCGLAANWVVAGPARPRRPVRPRRPSPTRRPAGPAPGAPPPRSSAAASPPSAPNGRRSRLRPRPLRDDGGFRHGCRDGGPSRCSLGGGRLAASRPLRHVLRGPRRPTLRRRRAVLRRLRPRPAVCRRALSRDRGLADDGGSATALPRLRPADGSVPGRSTKPACLASSLRRRRVRPHARRLGSAASPFMPRAARRRAAVAWTRSRCASAVSPGPLAARLSRFLRWPPRPPRVDRIAAFSRSLRSLALRATAWPSARSPSRPDCTTATRPPRSPRPQSPRSTSSSRRAPPSCGAAGGCGRRRVPPRARDSTGAPNSPSNQLKKPRGAGRCRCRDRRRGDRLPPPATGSGLGSATGAGVSRDAA